MNYLVSKFNFYFCTQPNLVSFSRLHFEKNVIYSKSSRIAITDVSDFFDRIGIYISE